MRLFFNSDWKKALFFAMEKLKKSKNGQSAIWAGRSSFWATIVVRVSKNWIFSQFLEFLNFGRFWPLLTLFWVGNVKYRFKNSLKITNSAFAFPTQNWVKSGQNRPKFENSENWEKMKFFHVSITFIALELVAPAQIEKNKI